MARKTLEEDINDFLDIWDEAQLANFLRYILPLIKLYNVDDDNDWVKDIVGGDEENVRTIRLIRTVYLMSKLCDAYSEIFCRTNAAFRRLWEKIEKQGLGHDKATD